MKLSGRAKELFDAFSRITATAFKNDRLLSCPTLSKTPSYGQVLRRYIMQSPQKPLSFFCGGKLALRYLAANLGHIAFLALSLLIIKKIRWKMPRALERARRMDPEENLLIIDTFALLPKTADAGRFHDLYLPGLAEEAEKTGHTVITLYRLYGSRHPRIVWKALRVLAENNNSLTELHLLTWRDWLQLFRHTFSYPFFLLLLIRRLRRFPLGSPECYIREALIHTAGQCVLSGEPRRLAGLRLGHILAGQSGAHIVSWYENQTIDKALHRGLWQGAKACGRKKVPVTGAQLYIWPPNRLNYHPDDAEAALGLTPDRILVNGPHFLPERSGQNYAVGPSLRYKHLFTGTPPYPAGKAVEDGRLLILLSYYPEDIRLVLQLIREFASTTAVSPPALSLAYKFHPATNPGDYENLLLPHARIFREGLGEALAKAAAVIGAASGALAESAALGIPTLCVERPGTMPELSLSYMPDYGKGTLWDSVATAEEIAGALARLKQALASPERAGQTAAFRDLLFTDPCPESIRRSFLLGPAPNRKETALP